MKLDFAKAYDSLDHDFLDDMLDDMRFRWKWRLWIRNCVSSLELSVLVIGSLTRQFRMERDL